MTIDRAIRVLAGTLVLLSLVLYHSLGPSALWLTAFVGANLLQSAFTGFCPAETILRKLGVGGATCAAQTDVHERV
jgi:Protein of unknown function (DUF2892)